MLSTPARGFAGIRRAEPARSSLGGASVFAQETYESDAWRFVGVDEAENPPTGWLALFANGNAPVCIMLTAGVAIHALSLRVVATVLPSAVAQIGGLRFFAWATTVAVVSAIWGAALAAPLARARGLRVAYRVSVA